LAALDVNRLYGFLGGLLCEHGGRIKPTTLKSELGRFEVCLSLPPPRSGLRSHIGKV
jgi:hypothetical protein